MKKYYETYLNYKEGILSGKWKSGEKLPSKRTAALADNVSVITIEKAYSLLEEEGYVEARQKRGYFVLPLGAIQPAVSAQDKKLNLLPEPEEISARDFEYSLWFKSVRKAISDQGDKLFIKAPGKRLSGSSQRDSRISVQISLHRRSAREHNNRIRCRTIVRKRRKNLGT